MPFSLPHPHPRFQAFASSLTSLINRKPDEATILQEGRALLQSLVAQDDWLAPEHAVPHPERYQQFLLYVDPQDRFSVVSFVWGPGQATPIHDHTVWGLIGMLRGAEQCQSYGRTAQGTWASTSAPMTLEPGHVEAVSPTIGDVHKVWNAHQDRASISIHVYGANIGKVNRWVYHEDGTQKAFVSGYSNAPWETTAPADIPLSSYAEVRAALLARQEIALLDVREEDPFAQCHPLFAANLPLGRVEADAWARIPRRATPLVVYDNGEGLAEPAARLLMRLGYTQVRLLQGGLQGWADAGGELFQDVNVPSKSFGEWVESLRHTPSLSASEVKALMDQGTDMVVLDARRFDEYQTMSIPTGISVPGAELVLRARALAPNPSTRIIVNCAGRTRSIIGTQSLVNAGIPNPVAALRNGTIGWTLAEQTLDHGAQRRFGEVSEDQRAQAALSARSVADRAGVQRMTKAALQECLQESTRTTYVLDVRTPEEYACGHLKGAQSAPGGQLVQETDHTVPVRGARIVLCDDDGVRANMSASWLAQMGWDVHVIDGLQAQDFSETPPAVRPLPDTVAPVTEVTAATVQQWLAPAARTLVIDVGTSAAFVKGHLPGAQWLLRSSLRTDLACPAGCERIVLTCGDGRAARFAVADVQACVAANIQVVALQGGNQAWQAAGLPMASGEQGVRSPRIDRYRRPYEGTQNAKVAMQAYLDWEFGLVEQLGRDGTHGFQVI